jgi:DeoR family glycerol-3-phosphate regulon repressor
LAKLNTRQNSILNSLQTQDQLHVEDLAIEFEVSQQTVRKDINLMCEQGLVRRLHGGVALPARLQNESFGARELVNAEAKKQLAHTAARIIPNGSSLILGIGTTALYTARALKDHIGLRIVTNNLRAAELLCQQPNHEVYVAGGKLRHSDQDVVGEQTTRFFDGFFVDYGILGAGALHSEFGLMEYDPLEAEIGRAIARNCKQTLLVADQSKWKRQATVKSLAFSEVNQFVTDQLEVTYADVLPGTCEFFESMNFNDNEK